MAARQAEAEGQQARACASYTQAAELFMAICQTTPASDVAGHCLQQGMAAMDCAERLAAPGLTTSLDPGPHREHAAPLASEAPSGPPVGTCPGEGQATEALLLVMAAEQAEEEGRQAEACTSYSRAAELFMAASQLALVHDIAEDYMRQGVAAMESAEQLASSSSPSVPSALPYPPLNRSPAHACLGCYIADGHISIATINASLTTRWMH